MDIKLSRRQRATEELFASIFDPDLIADLRRMGSRELGAGTIASLDDTDLAARETVWQTLCDLGGLRCAELSDQVVLAQQIGAALYQSPWADTVTAMEIAAATGHAETFTEGVAIAVRERAGADPDQPGDLDLTSEQVSAVRQFVPFAPDVAWFLLVGKTRLLLVPAGHAGVSWRRHDDIGRGDFYEVALRDVPLADTVDLTGPDGAAVWAASLVTARIRHAAYLVGLSQAALDETVGYARERQQFGQPIGRFQALAFRMADAATRVEAARLLVFLAAWQVDAGQDARLAALEALSTAADLARHVATEAVQLHGAVGMTEEHDAQLFYRRVAVDALLLGRPTELRRQAAALLSTKYR